MNKMKRFRKQCLCLLIFMGILFISISWVQAATLKIGVVAPLSGPAAVWGQGFQRGLELAVEDVEKDGGLSIKGEKYKVEVVAYDDKYSATESAKAATRLVSVDKVKFILGPVGSACALAMLPITEKAKVLVFGNGYSRKCVSPQFSYFFRITGTNVETSPYLIPYVINKYKVKKVAVIGPNDESGQDLSALDIEWYKRLGVAVLYNEFYERTQQDFYPQLSKIVSLKPDLLDTSASSPATQGLIAKQIRDLGYTGPIITPSGFTPGPAVRVGGKAVDGLYYATLELRNPKYYPIINSKYQKRYGAELEIPGVVIYYSISKLLFQTMQKTQSIDSTVIKTAMENMGTVNTLYGKIKWSGKEFYGINRQIVNPVDIAVIKEGEENIIQHYEAAE